MAQLKFEIGLVATGLGETMFKVGFVAYPAEPPDLASTIALAVKAVENSPKARITAWPQLEIFGAVIPDEVRSGIETADVLGSVPN
jgi:hypothetical protein